MKKHFVLAGIFSLAVSTIATPPAVASLSAPSAVVVADSSPNGTLPTAATATVSWRAVSGSNISYSVWATATNQTSREGTVANCQNGNCSSTVSSLTGGVSYSFVVTAIDTSTGNQAAASGVNFTPRSVPGAPTAGSAEVSNGQVVLTWTAPANNGGTAVTSYRISDGSNVNLSINGDLLTYTVTGLTNGSTYDFTIAAVNAVGTSATSTYASVTVTSAPSAPAAPTVSVSGSSIEVSWTAPAANGSTISGYNVYLVNSSGNDVGQPSNPTPATGTSLTISNVAAGSYTVQVMALAGNLQSARSVSSASVTVTGGNQDNTPSFNPNPIANLDIGASITVTVTAPSGGQVNLSISANPAGACTLVGTQINAIASGTCTLSATAPATGSFAEGSGNRTFNVKTAQTITFSPSESQVFPGTFSLSATASSGLSVRYVASGNCSISGTTLTFTAVGTCSVTASQPGNGVFSAAQSITRTIQVVAASQSGSGGGGFGGGGGGFGGGGGAGGGGSSSGGGGSSASGGGGGGSQSTARPVKTRSDYVAVTETGRATKSIRLSSSRASTSIKLGQTVRASLTGLARGTNVSTTVRTPDNKTFNLTTKTVGSSRSFSSSILKPRLKGTYTITVTAGKTKRVLSVRVN